MSLIPKIFAPDDIRNVQANLRQGVLQTDASVQACAVLDEPTKANWKVFRDTALTYASVPITSFGRAVVEDIGGGLILLFGHDAGTFGNSTESFYNTGRAYETTLVAWQSQLNTAGCTLEAPVYQPAVDELESDSVKLGKWALVAIITVAAAYGISRIAQPVIEGIHALELVHGASKPKPSAKAPRRARRYV